MRTVLITGSNRGIGLEFARQYAARGWRVIATCRNPDAADARNAMAAAHDTLLVDRLDVVNHAMIDSLAAKYSGTAIDVLLNNAGINQGSEGQMFGTIDYGSFDPHMQTNAVGPLKMAEAFAEHVAASAERKIMSLSSGMGSIEMAHIFRGVLTVYRMSKASLNMGMRVAAGGLKERGIVVGLLNPGLVDTDQSAGARGPKISPTESVSGMLDVIDGFTLETTGSFMSYDGTVHPW